jgi:hypothetical protein
MGTLKYDGITVEFDDLLLAHLEIVIVQKLRRQEAFLMTWQDEIGLAGGRSGIWLHPASMLHFHFAGKEKVVIDHDWTMRLMASANSAMGLFVSDDAGEALHPSQVENG